MRIVAGDGSEFGYEISAAGRRGYHAHYRIRAAGRSEPEAEAQSRAFASRDQALAWLRGEARARGFDVRGIA